MIDDVLTGRGGLRLGLRGLLALVCALVAVGACEAKAASQGLKSNVVLVVDQQTGETLISKNADVKTPIASLTKLMTGLVVLDAGLPLDEELEVGSEDVDREKNTRSRLAIGTRLSRHDLMLLALMSSENRAAMALSRHFPGGRTAFVERMNAKAAALDMTSTRFTDPTGISSRNVSTAHDLLLLMKAAHQYPLIRSLSTHPEHTVRVRGTPVKFVNSNRLVRGASQWDIEMQKTGFTNEAGRCLVMQANTQNRKLSMIFLDSFGTLTRYADATRVRQQFDPTFRAPRAAMKSGKTTKVKSASKRKAVKKSKAVSKSKSKSSKKAASTKKKQVTRKSHTKKAASKTSGSVKAEGAPAGGAAS